MSDLATGIRPRKHRGNSYAQVKLMQSASLISYALCLTHVCARRIAKSAIFRLHFTKKDRILKTVTVLPRTECTLIIEIYGRKTGRFAVQMSKSIMIIRINYRQMYRDCDVCLETGIFYHFKLKNGARTVLCVSDIRSPFTTSM